MYFSRFGNLVSTERVGRKKYKMQISAVLYAVMKVINENVPFQQKSE